VKMAEEEKTDVLLDLDTLPKNDQQPSNEDKDEVIKNLRRELEEELVVTSSLTHTVAEKTAEIEHLQVKIGDQEARIYNLEDQIEEWTTQADSCDKLLEQKDCEIEMLQKSLKIEKQQRRDLEDMMMEAGKESILQKEKLEKTVISLQEQVDHINREKVRELWGGKGDPKEERLKVDDTTMPDQAKSSETGVEKEAEAVADIKDEEKKPGMQKEEYKADMEALMDDLFALIKQNEELKEEIDRLKAEQSNIAENSRNVVKELETTIVEKAAEIQQQKHEIRRLSSAIETTESSSIMESGIDNPLEEVREELQTKIDDLLSINSELKMKLDEHESTKDSVANQYNKMKQKLEFEREQNIELNKQILEVSKLNDAYYTKFNEMEKGRVKGIDGTFGEQMKGISFSESPLDDLTEKQKELAKLEIKVEQVRQESEDSKETTSGNDMKNSSSKESFKLNNKLSLTSDFHPHSRSESVLMLMINLSKLLLLVSATFFVATSLRFQCGFSVGQVFSTVFATYVFLYNLWRIFSNGKESKTGEEDWKNIAPKLRQAMQDLILRLDEKNFEQFREIYESFIVQSFDKQEQSQHHDLKNENQYLTSSKNVLAKELTKYKEMNRSVHADYNQLKREIDVLRMKRVEEEAANQKQIQFLKEEIKSMDFKVSKMDMTENAVILNGFMQGSLLKLLLFAVLEGFVLMSASSSFILIPASFILLVLLALIYKTDLHLRHATNENRGYQKTIKELLHKVSKYKEEEKQTSDEVRELEAVVDKDYEIISKQRHAIERLERQLQRAINKYREKKRTLEKFFWLQEQSISNFNGLGRNGVWEHSGVDAIFNNTSHSVSDNEGSSKWKRFCFSMLGLAVMSYAAFSAYEKNNFYFLYTDLDSSYLVAGVTIIILALIPIKQTYGSRVKLQNTSLKMQLRESRDDEQALLEQIEMLRDLIATEREFVTKLEKEISSVKEVPERKVPKDEVNAVIDRLIEVSKQRDELVVTASSAKDKYDHIKKTLDDILSREKYLSDEVSSLRIQKRELRNDLMKEQLKHIEMYEEVKRLKSHSKKEENYIQDSDAEWDFAIDNFIKQSIDQGVEISPEKEFDIESESVLESLELAGSCAQKNRKKRTSKRGNKRLDEIIDESRNDNNVMQPLYHDENDHKGEQENGENECIPEKESRLFGKHGDSNEDELDTCAEQQIESVGKGITDNLELIDNTSRRNSGSEEKLTEDKVSGSMTSFTTEGEENEMTLSVKVGSEVGESNGSFPAKSMAETEPVPVQDLEHSNLRHLDTSDSNISRENSDSGTDCEKKIHFSIQSQQQEIGKLVKEIFDLSDLCSESKVSLKVELEDLASRPEDFFNFLTDHVVLVRYKILAEKTEMVAKVNSMEEEVEQFQQKIEKLQADVAKEKQARNHVISEYEEEYERLENRLSVAYEKIRKRLMEEKSLRDKIMVQYEDEIDDMQAKTTKILRGLQEQLMQERKEKEGAMAEIGGMVKKIKYLEAELTLIQEVEKSNQVLMEESEDIQSEFQNPHIRQLQRLVEEEANKRTQILKGKLDEALRSLDECKMKASFDDLIIKRLEKEDQILRTKMDDQSKQMKDMENELRRLDTMKGVLPWNALRKSKAGIIYNFSTKNGLSKWENPSDGGVIKVTRSSAGFGNASDILEEKPMPCSTENLEDSWFQLDLGQDKSIVPKEYLFCHGWLSSDGCARNWVFEGSVDGDKWHLLRRHVMDNSLNDRFMCGSWKLSESNIAFRYLRIRTTGTNSSDTNELYVGGIDVCGDILYKS